MGFYNKTASYLLPNKRVIDDLIERDTEPDEESFSPFFGMRDIFKEQMVGSKFGEVSWDSVRLDVEELNMSKLNESIRKKSVDEDGEDSFEYAHRLEDLDTEDVYGFVTNQLIGVKKNSNTFTKDHIASNNMVQPVMTDKETGAIYNLSDGYVSDLSDETSLINERELTKKIPILLKKLHDFSLMNGTHMFSMLVAYETAFRHYDGIVDSIKPKHILESNVYHVNTNGSIIGNYNPENANNRADFREAKDVIMGFGEYATNPYYLASRELVSIMDYLDMDITTEDPTIFTPQYINRMMCTYILSNQEVLTDAGFMNDTKIMDMFSSGSIFSPTTYTSSSTKGNKSAIVILNELSEQKMYCMPALFEIIHKNRLVDERKLRNPLELINNFISTYKRAFPNSPLTIESVKDTDINYEVMCDISNDMPVIFDISSFTTGFRDTQPVPQVIGIVLKNSIVVVLDNSSCCHYITTIADMLNFYEHKDYSAFWGSCINI